jgi:hypothetical protein
MSDVKQTILDDIKEIPDLESSNNHLFDFVIRFDDKFVDPVEPDLMNSEGSFPDLVVLCHSYVKMGNFLISSYYERSDKYAETLSKEFEGKQLFARIYNYTKEGTIEKEENFVLHLINSNYDSSTSNVLTRVFLFEIK